LSSSSSSAHSESESSSIFPPRRDAFEADIDAATESVINLVVVGLRLPWRAFSEVLTSCSVHLRTRHIIKWAEKDSLTHNPCLVFQFRQPGAFDPFRSTMGSEIWRTIFLLTDAPSPTIRNN
jgi:hypothetical protein